MVMHLPENLDEGVVSLDTRNTNRVCPADSTNAVSMAYGRYRDRILRRSAVSFSSFSC